MKNYGRAALIGAAMLVIAGCGGNDQTDSANAPLAYVPADTPFVVANLEPASDETRAALADSAKQQLPEIVAKLRQAGRLAKAGGNDRLAALAASLADQFDGAYPDVITQKGLDTRGLYAIYGLGLSPVARLPLADGDKFERFIERLADSAGQTLATDTLDGQSYRHADLSEAKLQLVIAQRQASAVVALLPANANDALLGRALGARKPDKSLRASNRLSELADRRGYLPIGAGYIDLTQLPALLTGEADAFAAALAGDRRNLLPASCRPGLARIAARMPLLSFGYETFNTRTVSTRFDLDLAADITTALSGVAIALPGLGDEMTAPLDVALGLPVSRIRRFVKAQARAVADKPFECPALAPLNQRFPAWASAVNKTAIPPLAGLTGVRLSVQDVHRGAGRVLPTISGTAIIGTGRPEGLIAMASNFAPSLARANLQANGEATQLQGPYASRIGQPLWAAMNKKAVGLGVGADQSDRLTDRLGGDTGATQAAFFKLHVRGSMAAKLIGFGAKTFGLGGPANGSRRDAATNRLAPNIENAQRAAKNLRAVNASAAINDAGLSVVYTKKSK